MREEITRLWGRAARLFRDHAAPRPLIAGGMAAALVGVMAGFALAPGKVWEPTEQAPIVAKPIVAPPPVTPMVDASGRTPDYVIGTDHLRRAPDPASVVRVTGPPTPTAAMREDLAEAGDRRWWAPWSWGRASEDDIRDREAERLADAREAARDARLAARERRQQNFEARMDQRLDARRDDGDRRYAYEADEIETYEPPPETRRSRRGD